MRVRIDTEAGTEEIDIDLTPDRLSLRESVRLEKLLGSELVEKLMASKLQAEEVARPSFIQAMLFVKLKTIRPEIELDGFDVDLEELSEALDPEEADPSPKSREPLSE